MSESVDLALLIRSRHSLIYAREGDEERLLMLVRSAAQACSLPVWTWSVAQGLTADTGVGGQYKTSSLESAVAFIEPNMRGVYVFLDAGPHLDDPVAVRRLKELALRAGPDLALVLAVQGTEMPSALEGLALPWEAPQPSVAEVRASVMEVVTDLKQRRFPVDLSDTDIDHLVTAVRGLSDREAARIINEAAMNDGALDGGDLPFVRSAKASLLGDDGVLEMYEPSVSGLDAVGGMASLKEWLAMRGEAFEPGAREFGLDAPRGILVTGVPGCGKSLLAKSLARTWGMPLVLLDPGRLFAPFIGQTEERLRDALDTVEAMSPCVLWIDEIEKGFAGGTGAGDGGVSMRVRGTFLRWLQDRPDGVFIIATSNQVRDLPPEFTRKGRFDEIFFVDLPGEQEREQIFELHLLRRKRDPGSFDVVALAKASEGFSGSEIEAAVVGAMYRSFAVKKELTDDAIFEEMAETSPLSVTRAEEVAALRAWAKERATPAA